jgi:2-polyprenyl-3-methyl-5-hydroxy-6-metoxy-1,4-benzoquinol methylase
MHSRETTLAFDNANAQAYFDRTADVDMSAEREAFTEALRNRFPAVAKLSVLDAGCGSGRDAKAFVQAGHRVSAFDGSAVLAKLASQHAGIPVQHQRFDELDERGAFHGVWACASLLHLTTDEFTQALGRIRAALKDDGVFFLTVKEGEGSRIDAEGRFFVYYRPGCLETLLNEADFEVLSLNRSKSRMGQSVTWLSALCCAVV